ncbi:N2227-domain-containing protein [Neoconidiobolus thromboides FSU 785]|nr:N2227-domain-containing protein [Neoconidiobolus thromboides FSU 785]
MEEVAHNTSSQEVTEEDIESNLESQHFNEVIQSFQHYGHHYLHNLLKKKQDFENLVTDSLQKETISDIYNYKIQKVAQGIKLNAGFLNLITEDHHIFQNEFHSDIKEINGGYSPTIENMDRVSITIKMIVRDWSKLGEIERKLTYEPIKDCLEAHFKDYSNEKRHKLKVLVPGAGLGRLAYEIATLGFSVQGNEFSYFMLLASSFMLNKSHQIECYDLYPYVTNFSNHLSIEDLIKGIKVPDILPHGLLPNVDFSMAAGDFVEVYTKEEQLESWNSVVTCFFIDTAKNVLDYIQIIFNLLKPGGIWINIGPLLYHFEEISSEHSIELTYEELRLFILAVGFEIHDEKRVEVPYTSSLDSMLVHSYNCIVFNAIKPNKST